MKSPAPHPLLLDDALWPHGLPPAYEQMSAWQQEAFDAYMDIEGAMINHELRTLRSCERYLRLHDELLDISRPIAAGTILWRGGEWDEQEVCGQQTSPAYWISCTLKRAIGKHFATYGGHDPGTSDPQRLMRISCADEIMAVGLGRIEWHRGEKRCALDEQEVVLIPGTHLTLDKITPAGTLQLTARRGPAPVRLWQSAA